MKQIAFLFLMCSFAYTTTAHVLSDNTGKKPNKPVYRPLQFKQKKQPKLSPQILKQLDPYWFLQNVNTDYLPLAGGTLTGTLFGLNFSNKENVITNSPFGLFYSHDLSDHYAIFRESGPWAHPFPDLRIAFHTGIKIGGHYSYGGTRFYNNSDMATELMSVGDGDNNVRIVNNLLVTAGKVGIGTTNPGAYKLAVNGDVKARKLRITQTDWPDYVFHKNYPLQSLSAVENFIQKHQHLPGIPSAKEVAQKGLDVGDTQALLLKKIEELTLHMIQQEKKMQVMEKELKKLKNNKQ